jgi:hypothetical protein
MYSRGHQIYENNQDDLSFSSHSDDFDESSNEYQKLEESPEDNRNESLNNTSQDVDIDKILNHESSMSTSLLHCLDGNDLSINSPQTSFERTRKRQLEQDDLKEESSTESLKRPLIENDSTGF